MRRFFAGLMTGLIVLTFVMPVTPHDDFGPGHAHAGSRSASDSISPSNDSSENQDDRTIVHCDGIAHLFTAITPTSDLNNIAVSKTDWLVNDVLVTHIAAPATPPPIS